MYLLSSMILYICVCTCTHVCILNNFTLQNIHYLASSESILLALSSSADVTTAGTELNFGSLRISCVDLLRPEYCLDTIMDSSSSSSASSPKDNKL